MAVMNKITAKIYFHLSHSFNAQVYFAMLIMFYCSFVFDVSGDLINIAMQPSLILFINVLPQLFAAILIFVVIYVYFSRARITMRESLNSEPINRPFILFNQKISKIALISTAVCFYAIIFLMFLIKVGQESQGLKLPYIDTFSFVIALTVGASLYGFSTNLSLSNKEIVALGLDYFKQSYEKNTSTSLVLTNIMIKELVNNLHEIFLTNWRFINQINLWSQIQVMLLALISGSDEEQKKAYSVLQSLIEEIKTAKNPKDYRIIIETLNNFSVEMKPLCSICSSVEIEGKPAVRKPIIEKIRENAVIFTALSFLIALIALSINILRG
jgi:hypothetical protein